jgi:hypothetical protein
VPDGDDETKSLLGSLHDCMMLVAPRGWTAVRARLTFVFPDFRVERLDVAAPDSTPPHPSLGTAQAAEMTRLGNGATELRGLLRARGKAWRGDELRCERGPDGARWIAADDGSPAALDLTLTPDELDALLYTDPLMAALDESQPRWREIQTRQAELLAGVTDWRLDQDAGTLRFRGPGRADLERPVEILGLWSEGAESWGWSWGNDTVDPRLAARVLHFCDPARPRRGLSVLWRDSFPCDRGFADVLAAYAAEQLGADALWRQELGDGVVYFAVMPAGTAAG